MSSSAKLLFVIVLLGCAGCASSPQASTAVRSSNARGQFPPVFESVVDARCGACHAGAAFMAARKVPAMRRASIEAAMAVTSGAMPPSGQLELSPHEIEVLVSGFCRQGADNPGTCSKMLSKVPALLVHAPRVVLAKTEAATGAELDSQAEYEDRAEARTSSIEYFLTMAGVINQLHLVEGHCLSKDDQQEMRGCIEQIMDIEHFRAGSYRGAP